MQFAHSIGRAGMLERQDGHAEPFVDVLGIDPPQSHQVVEREPEMRLKSVERVVDQIAAEPIVPCFHRRVCGKNAFRLRLRQGILERPDCGQLFTDQFQRQKSRVAFVHVKHRGLNTKRPQEAHTADTEQNLLHNARGAVAAVNTERQIAIVLFVLRPVRVEQINRATTDIDAPGVETDFVHRDFHLADQRFAF